MKEQRIAIIGSRGRLGAALVRAWADRHEIVGFHRETLDLAKPDTIEAALAGQVFDWVINCAAATNVDACERDPASAFVVNADAPAAIARACASSGSRLIHVSTDYVFDGEKRTPYAEDDPVSPISVYGDSKARGDEAVLAILPGALIARVSWVFGPEKPSFVDAIIRRAQNEERVEAVDDKWSAPSYTSDLADWTEALISNDAPGGHYHLCNAGTCTWREYGEFALGVAARLGVKLKTTTVHPVGLADIPAFVARRPVYTVLGTDRFREVTGIAPRSWQDAVECWLRESIK